MAFCSVCGKELPDGARFCTSCGTPTPNANTRSQFLGTVKKCPNCGETINSFTVKCPTCGFEIRDIQAVSSVKELSARIQQLEASRPREKKHLLYTHLNYSATDEQISNIVSSFAIPNTKEDLFEFLILAASNIKMDAYGLYSYNMPEGQKMIHQAWLSKFEQAYNKACISFGSEPEFSRIEEIYTKKQKEISHRKKIRILCWVALFGSPFIMFGIIALLSVLL